MNIGTAPIAVAACLCVSSALPVAPSRVPSAVGSGVPSEEAVAGPGMVVVNEFAPGAYVELRNNARSTVDIGGYGLWLCGSGAVTTELRVSLGQALSPGGFYVIASSSFTGVPADQTYGGVLPSGGAVLFDPDYGWADGVAVVTGSPCGERTPAPACGQASTARDAVSTDTGDNATDFACRIRSPGESNP